MRIEKLTNARDFAVSWAETFENFVPFDSVIQTNFGTFIVHETERVSIIINVFEGPSLDAGAISLRRCIEQGCLRHHRHKMRHVVSQRCVDIF